MKSWIEGVSCGKYGDSYLWDHYCYNILFSRSDVKGLKEWFDKYPKQKKETEERRVREEIKWKRDYWLEEQSFRRWWFKWWYFDRFRDMWQIYIGVSKVYTKTREIRKNHNSDKFIAVFGDEIWQGGGMLNLNKECLICLYDHKMRYWRDALFLDTWFDNYSLILTGNLLFITGISSLHQTSSQIEYLKWSILITSRDYIFGRALNMSPDYHLPASPP